MLLIFCWAPTNWQSSNLGKMNELSKFLRFNQLFLMDLMMSTISKTKLNFFVDCMGIVFWVTLLNWQKNVCINEHWVDSYPYTQLHNHKL